jgi:hypothetical protein
MAYYKGIRISQIVSGAILLVAFGWSLWLIAYALCDMMEVFK